MIQPKDIFNKSTDKLVETMDKLASVPDSKILNKSDIKEYVANLSSLSHTLTKCSKSGLIPPELKDINSSFEKSGFDITKMPSHISSSLARTYQGLSKAYASNPGYFKNSATKGYIDCYELFTGVKFKNFINKMKSSKAFEKISKSNESLNHLSSIENLDAYISELNLHFDKNTKSSEFLGEGLIAKIGAPLATQLSKFAAPVAGQFASLTSSVYMLSGVLMIVLVVIAILIISLCIVSSIYQQRVVEAIEALTQGTINNIDETKLAMKMEESIPSATNKFMIKPMICCTKFMNKFTEPKNVDNVEKSVKCLDKTNKSKEDFDRSQEVVGTSAFVGTLSKLLAFGTGNPIAISLSIIVLVVSIVCLVRGLIYWINHFRFKVGELLLEQDSMIGVNVDQLIAKVNDPKTPEPEKERLRKVISRQENIAKGLRKMSDILYKECIKANSDCNDELTEDSNIDFDGVADRVVEDVDKAIAQADVIVTNNTTVDPDTVQTGSIIF